MQRFLNWRRIVIAFLVATIATVAITVIGNIMRIPDQHFGKASLPPVTQQQPGSTDLQQVQAKLGPFVMLPVSDSTTPDTQYPAVLLIGGDGSISASQAWTVPTSGAWAKQDAPQISAQSPVSNGYVTFRLSTSTVLAYTVKVGQPFVLDSVPQQLMYFGADGSQHSTNMASAELLRRHL